MLWFVPALIGWLALPLPQDSQRFDPPLPRVMPVPVATVAPPGALRVAVVKSWSSGTASAWGELNLEWSLYGPVPIAIDTSLAGGGFFTYAQLVASGADVVVLSDPAGGNKAFSPAEVAALGQYIAEGHNLIGTFLTFLHGGYDNRALAPLFGFAPGLTFTSQPSNPPISNQFRILRPSPLFRGILLTDTGTLRGRTWQSQGYSFTQTQADQRWDADELGAAHPVAQCDDRLGIISVYHAPTYAAIYISNMPEYYGGRDDKQLLYNALTYKRR